METKQTKMDLIDTNYKRAATNIAQNIIHSLEEIKYREDFIKQMDVALHNYNELKKNYFKERQEQELL